MFIFYFARPEYYLFFTSFADQSGTTLLPFCMTGLSRHFAVSFYQIKDVFFLFCKTRLIINDMFILYLFCKTRMYVACFLRHLLTNQRQLYCNYCLGWQDWTWSEYLSSQHWGNICILIVREVGLWLTGRRWPDPTMHAPGRPSPDVAHTKNTYVGPTLARR